MAILVPETATAVSEPATTAPTPRRAVVMILAVRCVELPNRSNNPSDSVTPLLTPAEVSLIVPTAEPSLYVISVLRPAEPLPF
jgi:hypothetical protein